MRYGTSALLMCLALMASPWVRTPAETFRAPASAQAESAWVLEMSRSGGMRPRKESVSISSGGEITVTSEHFAQGKSVVDCTLKEKLSPADLRELRRAVRAARVSAWLENYEDPKHPPCCDQPTIRLSLRRRMPNGSTRSYNASWYPGSSELRPADLEKTATLAQELWNRTSGRCVN